MQTVMSETTKLGRFSSDKINLAVSILVIVSATCFFIISSSNFFHWFVAPVALCGIIIGTDAVAWLRRKIDFIDPVGMIGIYGFHFFYLAPMLHVYLDYWLPNVTPPEDWRTWIGGMAILNLFGLILYRYFRNFASYSAKPLKFNWQINERRMFFSLLFFMLVTLLSQVAVYQKYGGISGFINTFEEGGENFSGMGIVFMISESFPILSLILLVFIMRLRRYRPNWFTISTILIIFFAEKILFGGLRGSRSNTIWILLWAIGIIHLYLRSMSRRFLLVVAVCIVAFMYIYGFYKTFGVAGLTSAANTETRVSQEEKGNRDIKALLLWDFGRSDVQAYILYRLFASDRDYNLSYGRTYLASASLLLPKYIVPIKPLSKVKEGTEIQYGRGMYEPGLSQSSRIYGLAGEGMLNFGFLAPPFLFGLLGLVVGRLRSWMSLLVKDSRIFIIPFISIASFIVIISDSDNIIFFLFKQGFVPVLAILLGSSITKVRAIR